MMIQAMPLEILIVGGGIAGLAAVSQVKAGGIVRVLILNRRLRFVILIVESQSWNSHV